MTGSAVQWLRDGAGLIEKSRGDRGAGSQCADNGGVYFVPAMTGLSAPWWDFSARGMIIGITRGTSPRAPGPGHPRGIVYPTKDFLQSMKEDSGVSEIRSMKVDGGAVTNDWLMQFQADMLDAEVVRPVNPEATVMGAAYMAGLGSGYWSSDEEAFAGLKSEKVIQATNGSQRAEQTVLRVDESCSPFDGLARIASRQQRLLSLEGKEFGRPVTSQPVCQTGSL